MITLGDFNIITPDLLEKLFEINPNRKEYVEEVHPDYPQHKYLYVENVLMNPKDVRDFLQKASYICGTNDLIPDKTGAPGMQQPIANEWTKPFLMYLRSVLFHKKIYTKNLTWYDFSCYCNVFWNTMMSIDSNYRPHIDPADMAFNLFLSENCSNDGTSIFSMELDGESWIDLRELEKKSLIPPARVSAAMDWNRVGNGIPDKWCCFEGDDVYTLRKVIPAEFNCLSAYKGSHFHTAHYDTSQYPDDYVRYSLVSMLALSLPPKGANPFLTKKPTNENQDTPT